MLLTATLRRWTYIGWRKIKWTFYFHPLYRYTSHTGAERIAYNIGKHIDNTHSSEQKSVQHDRTSPQGIRSNHDWLYVLYECAGWVVAYELRGEGLVWLIGAVVCLIAANRGSNCSLTRAMDGRIVRCECGIISSCQSAAISEVVKRFWSRSHVRSAITIVSRPLLKLPLPALPA